MPRHARDGPRLAGRRATALGGEPSRSGGGDRGYHVRKRLVRAGGRRYRLDMPSPITAWSRARRTRDARFDGRFFVAVASTGIYCRPVCPAPSPHERHVRYFESAAAAAEAGFRPCLRCRPEVAPGTPAWLGTPATVQRALRLIDAGVTDGVRVSDLATALGVGPRHLHRLFLQHLGASPLAIIQTRRLHFAKQLVDGTALPFAEIAHAAGFGSIRRFNAAVRHTWDRTPSALRRERAMTRDRAPFEFLLAYRPPYDWNAMLRFLEARAVPGLERVRDGRYARTVEVQGDAGWLEVIHDRDRHALRVAVHVTHPRALYTIVGRVRRMFDLDADVGGHRAASSTRSAARVARVARRPACGCPAAGIRSSWPCAPCSASSRRWRQRARWSRGWSRRMERRSRRRGPDAHVPRPGRPRRRAARGARRDAVARGVDPRARRRGRRGPDRLTGGELDAAAVRQALIALPGIGDWTAEYVAMRALGDPDAFPAADLVLARAAGLDRRALAARAEALAALARLRRPAPLDGSVT